jgi:hypothetical protein
MIDCLKHLLGMARHVPPPEMTETESFWLPLPVSCACPSTTIWHWHLHVVLHQLCIHNPYTLSKFFELDDRFEPQ